MEDCFSAFPRIRILKKSLFIDFLSFWNYQRTERHWNNHRLTVLLLITSATISPLNNDVNKKEKKNHNEIKETNLTNNGKCCMGLNFGSTPLCLPLPCRTWAPAAHIWAGEPPNSGEAPQPGFVPRDPVVL